MKKSNLPNNVGKAIDKFVRNLQGAYGESLVSVILYGSAVSGEYEGHISNVNIAVILKDAALGPISKALRFVNKREFSEISPIFFTEDYIRRSTDVFPIEFTDMKENNKVLYGRDVLKDLNIDIKNMRFQCEHELRSKIISLKKIYLRTTDRTALRKILFRSFASVIHILRSLISLKGRRLSYAREDLLNEISEEFGIDIAALREISDARSDNTKLGYKETSDLFIRFVGTLETVTDKVDRL